MKKTSIQSWKDAGYNVLIAQVNNETTVKAFMKPKNSLKTLQRELCKETYKPSPKVVATFAAPDANLNHTTAIDGR